MYRQLTTVELLQLRPSFEAPFITAETLKRSLNCKLTDLENESPFRSGARPFKTVFVDSSRLRKRRRLEMGESLFNQHPSRLPYEALSGVSPNRRPRKAPESLTKLSLVTNLHRIC